MRYYLSPDVICNFAGREGIIYPLGRDFPMLPLESAILLPAPDGWYEDELHFWISSYSLNKRNGVVFVNCDSDALPENMRDDEYEDLLNTGWIVLPVEGLPA